MKTGKLGLVLLPLLWLAGACGSMNNTNASMAAMPGALPASDVAGIVATANEGEIQQGQAAAPKATSAEVRAFAQMMVSDHTAALTAARDTFARNNVTPSENDTTRTLREGSQRTIANLATYNGAAFDRMYMQSQVDLHQWLLTTMDTVLIPSSRGEMRTLLETQRASVASHLERARQIRAGL
jgi:putative membrane protein